MGFSSDFGDAGAAREMGEAGEVAQDPIALFTAWLSAAQKSEPNDPNTMALATVDAGGCPNVRMVLLKGVDARGFCFYTNMESTKGAELKAEPQASFCFHWKSLRRQVRVRGAVIGVDEAQADAYFASRSRGSRLGAWASDQSRVVADRAVLEAKVKQYEEQFKDKDVPRPPHWAGYRILPTYIEFWQDGAFRLHDRLVYRRDNPQEDWQTERLSP